MRVLYMDSSALVKRYVEEEESPAVVARIESAPIIGTALITRIEVPAALKKAVRTGDMDRDEAEEAHRDFLEDWPDLTRIKVTDVLAARAGDLAWRHDLRAYDAAQLAAALTWRDQSDDAQDEIVFACYDRNLRGAATAENLEVWPE